ncbi:polysaccharide deacetylase family protein [Aeromicrobium chenweiae]|nr:polysaccharide deacetylase family protein [Aeromicrobium chenweiae]
MQNISPNGPIKLAVTVDDPFMWKGADFPPDYSPAGVATSMADAFAEHGVPGVYSFASTLPTDDHPEWLEALDSWVERGHHVGAHTHSHSSLNWGPADPYIDDIDRNMGILEPWIAQAPTRYFRYAFDMWGDEQAKTDAVQLHLARRGYVPAPITTWFYDVQFLVSYIRTLVAGDEEGRAWIRKTFASTAVESLRSQAAAARAVFGRDPVHIALIHGTPVAGDCYGDVLAAYAEHGVEFVTLEEAMADPANQIVAPTVTRFFRNSTQKWAEYAGIDVENTPPQVLHQVREICLIEGMDENAVLGPALVAAAESVGATFVPTDLDWSPEVLQQ